MIGINTNTHVPPRVMKASGFDIAVNRSANWLVNGEPVADDVEIFLRDQTVHEIQNWGDVNCPHCNCGLISRRFEDVAEDNQIWHNNRSYVHNACSRCAYWEFHGSNGGNKCMDRQEAILLSAIAARFSGVFPDGCSQELAQYLRRNPSYWNEMEPKRLEKFVADVFKSNYHDAEAIHVGKPFDQGVDVIFIESNGTRWLVQVKRREKPERAEGFATLQSILGALALDGARHGIVVSTADSFSFHARRGQRRAEREGFIVEFMDKGILDRMISPLLPQTPWSEIFRHPELSDIEMDVQQHFWGPECGGQLILPGI